MIAPSNFNFEFTTLTEFLNSVLPGIGNLLKRQDLYFKERNRVSYFVGKKVKRVQSC